jgi:hypothetical protein
MAKRIHKKLSFETQIPIQIDFIGLTSSSNGLVIHVCEFATSEATIIEVDFGSNFLAFRSMDEGNFLEMTADADMYDPPDSPIVLVENSDFLAWFHAESLGIHQNANLVHVAILTQNEWVDVISHKTPIVKLGAKETHSAQQ